jgi:hypothetical protein
MLPAALITTATGGGCGALPGRQHRPRCENKAEKIQIRMHTGSQLGVNTGCGVF